MYQRSEVLSEASKQVEQAADVAISGHSSRLRRMQSTAAHDVNTEENNALNMENEDDTSDEEKVAKSSKKQSSTKGKADVLEKSNNLRKLNAAKSSNSKRTEMEEETMTSSLSSETTIRFQKTKLMTLQNEMDKLAQDNAQLVNNIPSLYFKQHVFISKEKCIINIFDIRNKI